MALGAATILGVGLSACFAAPPQIIALQPSRGSVGVAADAPISVQFDRPVTPRSVAGHFAVSPRIAGCNLSAAFSAEPGAACRVSWSADRDTFVLRHPGAVLAPDTLYHFTLRGGFSDSAGAVNTVDHHWDLTTAAAPQVRAVSPGDGDVGVPVEAALAVTFSGPMNPATIAPAISLDPAVTETQVLQNRRDPSRFVVLPGRPLLPATRYRLSVGTSASDIHGQRLPVAVSIRFTTGTLGTGSHAVILARRSGEAASEVLLASMSGTRAGEPGASPVLLEAPRCALAAGCGRATTGSPLYAYDSAGLASTGRWLAVTEEDVTVPNPSPVLVVLDPATGTVATSIPGASLPSWSPDGELLAFASGATVQVYRPATGALAALPPGDRLLAPPLWAPDGEQLVLDVGGPAAVEHVELADAVVGARYPVPGLAGPSSNPVTAPDGHQLAVFVPGTVLAGTWVVDLGAGSSPPRLLDPDLVPLGYAGAGTIVAIARPPGQAPSLVRVSASGDVQIRVNRSLIPAALNTVVVAQSGRELAYLAPDNTGVVQVFAENVDGSDPHPLTSFAEGVEAVSVALSP